MIGVAPPSMGSNVPSAAPAAAAFAPPAAAPFAAPAAQAPTAAFAAAPPAYEAPPQQPPASTAQPVSSVNPLGGTMVADASTFGGAFPGSPSAPPGGGYDPNAYGSAPPAYGSAPPAAYGSAPAAAYGSPPPGAMAPIAPAPMQHMEDDSMTIPGTVGGPNPIVTVLLIVLTCGIYGIYLLIKGKRSQPQG